MTGSSNKAAQDGTPQSHSGNEKTTQVSKGLHTLFVEGLKDIYYAENALVKAIPKMIKNATDAKLVEALTGHLEVTKGHVTRLEKVFTTLGEKAQGKDCPVMDGLVKEAEEIMNENEKGIVRDAGIILAGRKVEHYEMATYKALSELATKLGENEAASLLKQTLAEEMEADSMLSKIAGSTPMSSTNGGNQGSSGTNMQTDMSSKGSQKGKQLVNDEG